MDLENNSNKGTKRNVIKHPHEWKWLPHHEKTNRCWSLLVEQPPQEKKERNNWSSWNCQRRFLRVFLCHNKAHTPPSPHLSLGTVNPDLSIPSIPPLHSHPSPLSPYGKLQGPLRDHHSATRRRDPRNCQTQGGLSVREDQSLCKPLRHSTPPAGTLCLQPFCLA